MIDVRFKYHRQQVEEPVVSIIIPAFNEQEVILEFHRRLLEVIDKLSEFVFELLYVNDGSQDQTLGLLRELIEDDHRINVLDLSRNFGKEAAMTAGIDHVRGDAVIILDADLQDSPELIPKMLDSWRQGYDVVCMQRASRDGESFLKKFTARMFYLLMGRVGEVRVPENVGDFRLMNRAVIEALRTLPERTRFMKGVFAWVGFKTCTLPYHRDARYAGETKWNYWKLWNFALEGLTSFTVAPLKIASYVGILTSLAALGFGAVILIKTLFIGDPVPGYPSLMVVILFLGGLQLMAIGIVGEYLGRIFIESKQRPVYLKKEYYQGRSQAELSKPLNADETKKVANQ
ncbi:MAG: glycosyltransferase family 2 protein [Desulfuromusa sp.]|jgi:glycosyltransferase involved in cell wall biosynthesis|nr:glycosyltransferase family 2 protein [Desulfuromusa sp.]